MAFGVGGGPAYAGTATIENCYSSAESAYTGLSMTVKSGSTTLLTSSDIDAVMQKVAENHTDSQLDVTYNTNGKFALKSSIDCVFDAEHITLSGIWLNANESELTVRGKEVVAFDEYSNPEDEFVFDSMDFASPSPDIFLFGGEPTNSAGCSFEMPATAHGSYDYYMDFAAKDLPRCIRSTGCDTCTAPKRNCLCLTAGESHCAKQIAVASGSNNAIVRLDPI